MAFSAHPEVAGSGAGIRGEDEPAESRFIEQLSLARGAGARLPDFFIIGHAKCGTTALHRMLAQHPQIYLPSVKETEFLSSAPPTAEGAADGADRRPKRQPRTLESYLALFAAATEAQYAGEASPQYIRSPLAANRIAALRPDARIVAIFREPADFLRSLHLQLLDVGIETERDFATALALEGDRRRGLRIPSGCHAPERLLYSEHVRYVEQLRRYHERFGRERVLSLIYEDFRADNIAVVQKVLRFLGVDDAFEIQVKEANETVHFRSRRARELTLGAAMGRGPILRAVKRGVKTVAPAPLRRRALRAAKAAIRDSAPPPPDERLMRQLRERFAGEVLAASEYLDRDLITLWGYDQLR
jgi:hypothetical protein